MKALSPCNKLDQSAAFLAEDDYQGHWPPFSNECPGHEARMQSHIARIQAEDPESDAKRAMKRRITAAYRRRMEYNRKYRASLTGGKLTAYKASQRKYNLENYAKVKDDERAKIAG